MSELVHYGTPRHSGRYPYGSGERPFQSEDKSKVNKGVLEKQRLVKEVLGQDLITEDAKSINKSNPNEAYGLKKGKTVQHITGIPFDKVREGQLYVSATEFDNALYSTFLGLRLKSKGWDPQRVTLTLKRDLKVPSSKTQINIFHEMVKNNKKQILIDISEWLFKKKKNKIYR